ncbi:MAG: succinate dehydrogenase, cytochrome b556 subunit [Gammaproteobacteria bacterium]|nr:succinate dehydrogenase, cytochrome b556 subunit [Gammaproteobacteria bacterium]MDH5593700.1 succinate dehydrogenase, cytochrome b556 subunit [Gammaproteobacteria bacterium]
MSEQQKRPKFLNLLKIRMPIGAIVSIAHRFSGVILFMLIPFLIYILEISLKTEQGFQQLVEFFNRSDVRVVLLLIIWMFAHHLVNGIRLLLLDLDIGISRSASRLNSWLMILLGILITAFFAGVLL